MNPEIRYYLSVFFRRLPLFLVVSLSISSAAAAIALILPTVYSANAVVLMERPQIPDALVTSTVQMEAREQLQIIQRRLMTRTNLIEIARENQVFEQMSDMSADQIVTSMRANTDFRSNTGRDQATLLTITFSGRTAEIASQVANEYITRILADNLRERQRQAGDTLRFFKLEVERLGTELDAKSERIKIFQNANSDALPDSLNFRMSRTALLQERISQMARDKAALEDQRERLVSLFERTGQVSGRSNADKTFEEQQLEGLRNQLSSALAVYSDGSPQVRMLRSQVAALEEVVATQVAARVGQPEDQSGQISPSSLLELQLSEVDGQLEQLSNELEEVNSELARLEDSINRTPNNAIALETLNRDYENVQQQYNRALDRLSTASTGALIEDTSRGQRLTVIEQAVAPSQPSSPNRPLIAAGGAAVGMATASFLVILLEAMNKAIRRPVDLVRGLGLTPIATVPYISTYGEKLRRRVLILAALLVVIAGIPAALYVVHYQVMPLDLIVDKILEKLRF